MSDGFDPTTGSFGLWDAQMLGVGSESWSYRLIGGADLSAADYRQVISGNGSVLIGQGATALSTNSSTTRSSIISNYYQTIRTGTGDIGIYSGSDVQLLNPLVSIYTAGSQVAASSADFLFDTPILNYTQTTTPGSVQTPIYGAQYSMGGGNVTISAENDIARYVLKGGVLVADSSRKCPRTGSIVAASCSMVPGRPTPRRELPRICNPPRGGLISAISSRMWGRWAAVT
ncbi:MAG: hypothetical protein QM796_06795 [Chthoniobacteraceae bacterium]